MPMRPSANVLQMHTVVDQPLTEGCPGRISCRPIGIEPIHFEWTGPGRRPVETDLSGSEALQVEPGRYRVVATDGMGMRADVVLDVAPTYTGALTVREYKVTGTSTSTSRDGMVEAVGDGLSGHRFLWTHGTETSGPVLRDVPTGLYAAALLPSEGSMPVLIHLCAPARVGVHNVPLKKIDTLV